jgi:hypothetical protein
VAGDGNEPSDPIKGREYCLSDYQLLRRTLLHAANDTYSFPLKTGPEGENLLLHKVNRLLGYLTTLFQLRCL